MHRPFIVTAIFISLLVSCGNPAPTPSGTDSANGIANTAVAEKPVRLVTLDPGHFHAALVQKSMYADIDSVVHVYAPEGPDVQSHIDKINAYNTRASDPTHWVERVYTGPDFLQKMLNEKAGNTVVLAGNNLEKTNYILQSLQAGFHVLADKPMVIDNQGFDKLQKAFDTAAARKEILYDIMTERYEITGILQRELAQIPAIFGTQEKGAPTNPGVREESVHRWYKNVSGKALTRPAWFFDDAQQGEAIVDVMTHLVDLVQWGCFPDQILDYKKDIKVNNAQHWTTDLPLSQFKTITQLNSFPNFLKKQVTRDSILKIYANGRINYQLKGVYVQTTATWTYQGPPKGGGGDTYQSVLRGTKANLIILQDEDHPDPPSLHIMPVTRDSSYGSMLIEQFKPIQAKYPGIELKKTAEGWEVTIPAKYREGHESHFARVTEKFLEYVKNHDMPAWEVPNMIAKYYTTTRALQLARSAFAAASLLSPASDTLTAQVSEWSRLKVHPAKYGESRTVLNGSTRDLSLLDIRAITLSAGQSLPEEPAGNTPTPPGGSDELLIIREGRLSILVKDSLKILGPGGIGLFPAGERPTLTNTGTSPLTFYLFRIQSRSPENRQRAREAGGPFLIDWPQMVMKPTAKGEGRQIFSRPVVWLGKIDMHATTLNPGEVSHPPHTHRAEEIILLRSGHIQMHIGDQYYKAAGGDLVFLASGVPHALENRSNQRCEYFALQWQQ